MGCCGSSCQNSHNPQPNSHYLQTSDTTHLAILEEETIIKEVVLSETSKVTKPILPDSPPLVRSPIPSSAESSIDPKRSDNGEGISDTELSLPGVSDFFSFSAIDGVLSTSTVTKTTMRETDEEEDEDEVVGPPVTVYGQRKKSFSGDFTGGGGRMGKARSPVKKGSFGPGRDKARRPRKRRGSVGRLRMSSLDTRGVGDGHECMLEKGVPLKTRAPGCRSIDANAVKSRRVVEEPDAAVSGAIVESLENPLVSFECFIFL